MNTRYPTNMRHRAIVGSMLGQRRRRWANIDPTMALCLMFAGYNLQVNAKATWTLGPPPATLARHQPSIG